MNKLVHLTSCCFILILLCNSPLWASQFIRASSELETQRRLFQGLLDNGKLGTISADKAPASLESYPLFPYIQYHYLANRIGREALESFSQFFDKHDDLALSSHLRKQLLLHLGEQKQWHHFNTFYRHDDYFFSDTELVDIQCYHIQSELFLQKGNEDALEMDSDSNDFLSQENVDTIIGIFQNTPIHTQACTELFNVLFENELISQEIILQRISQTLDNKSEHEALLSRLNSGSRQDYEQCQKLLDKPSQLQDTGYRLNDNSFTRACIHQALQNISNTDPPLALTLWKEQLNQYDFTIAEKKAFKDNTSLALFIRNSEHFLSWLDLPEENAELNEKALVEFIREQNWTAIISLYPKLSPQEQEASIWQYWYARSHIEYDHNRDIHPNAYRILEALSRKRDYYGFLASFHLNTIPEFSSHSFPLKNIELERIANKAAIIRAHEFYQLGDRVNASREWYFARQDFSAQEDGVAAILAFQWGWLEQAIITASRSNQFNNIQLRFPLGFSEEVNFYAARYSIPNEWVFATIRQESAFAANAQSSAGALGLMQIMPYTGKMLAAENKLRNFRTEHLFDVNTNVQFGTYYLAKLRKQYQGNLLLASAAYNAGPSKVNQWLRESPKMDIEMWIETIPYRETRNYVKNILTYQVIYQHLLGREVNAEHLFLPIK